MHSLKKSRCAFRFFLIKLFISAGILFAKGRNAVAEEIYDLTTKNPLGTGPSSLSFSRLFCTAANWMVTMGIIVVVIVIGIAGIRFLTSQGDEARRRSAKTTLSSAIIGLLVLLFAKGIILIILNFIGSRLTSMTC